VIRSLFQAGRTATDAARTAKPPATLTPGGELRKDPVCGTYVSTSGSPSLSVNGETVYFCSTECRDRYRK
jgi:YHS domain-containing protein